MFLKRKKYEEKILSNLRTLKKGDIFESRNKLGTFLILDEEHGNKIKCYNLSLNFIEDFLPQELVYECTIVILNYEYKTRTI